MCLFKKILVVDNDEKIANFINNSLLGQKCKIRWAGNKNVALNIINEQQIDILFLDFFLDGIRATELLMNIHEINSDIIIIIMSTNGTLHDAVEAT